MGKFLALMGNPLALTVTLVSIYSIGFVSGWTLNGWRLGADVAELKGQKALLLTVNDKCKTDVAEVKNAIRSIQEEAQKASKQAVAEMKKAAAAAAVHQKRATQILNRPPVLVESQWCETMKVEQLEYVQARRRGGT